MIEIDRVKPKRTESDLQLNVRREDQYTPRANCSNRGVPQAEPVE
jgi:hypothetical protein